MTVVDPSCFASRPTVDELSADRPVLCSSHRLAVSLRLAFDRVQIARGLQVWRPLSAQTLAQWLQRLIDEALLAGEIPAGEIPGRPLAALQEQILWERAIEADHSGDPLQDPLFDKEGLAAAAAEANALCETWRIPLGPSHATEESRSFLRWRHGFRRLCAEAGWIEPARYLNWQIERIAAGVCRLPGGLVFAGFDRFNPQEVRLIELLGARDVTIATLAPGGSDEPPPAVVHALPDREAECRAAAGWACARLKANPQARLGIVVPELQVWRAHLAAILDDALDPETARPGQAERPRRYNFSLGLPLASQPVIAVALSLLDLAAQSRRIEQQSFGALLTQPHWSAGVTEAEGRARLELRMREHLPPTVTLDRLRRFPQKSDDASRLVADLSAFASAVAALPARQRLSSWAASLEQLLDAAAWPGERPLSSHEYQAQRAFAEVIKALADLDAVLGRVGLGEAVRRLRRLARERIFQPETENDPRLEIMGLLEVPTAPLHGLWVMGMNEHLWPPVPRPNPLLPALLQRQARAPNASAEVQGEFGLAVHRRLLASAVEVRFSWAQSEGDRELRPSPLLAGIASTADRPGDARALRENLAARATFEAVTDDQAPAVAKGETLSGGTGLLRAQAICPAWAFYRYRLGAKALRVPVEGLDAAERGTLMHLVLQHFWRGRGSQDLLAMDEHGRRRAVAEAVDSSLAAFAVGREDDLKPNFLALETERLARLLDIWLGFEAQRPLAFRVIACEQRAEVCIAGISAHVVVDRIDELEDGRQIIVDYKTGAKTSVASWGEARISEPQLPLYAVTAKTLPAAVALARVRPETPGFVGIAASGGLLPGVPGVDDGQARRLFPVAIDWQDVLVLWRTRLDAIAREIEAGCAAVSFDHERDLEFCEVRPLLRLAERRAQNEGAP